MKTRTLLLSVVLPSVAACGGSGASPSADASPSIHPTTDLSAPQRFRPWVDQLSLSPPIVRVGQTAVVTASVHSRSGMLSPEVSWILFAEPTSVGNGVLSSFSGSGQLRSEFQPNYKGEVVLVAYAIDSNGVPSMPTRAVFTVVL